MATPEVVCHRYCLFLFYTREARPREVQCPSQAAQLVTAGLGQDPRPRLYITSRYL